MDTLSRGFCIVHASGGDWDRMTDACLAGLDALPGGANLGFVYVTDIGRNDIQKFNSFGQFIVNLLYKVFFLLTCEQRRWWAIRL